MRTIIQVLHEEKMHRGYYIVYIAMTDYPLYGKWCSIMTQAVVTYSMNNQENRWYLKNKRLLELLKFVAFTDLQPFNYPKLKYSEEVKKI